MKVLHFIYASEGGGAERQLSLILAETANVGLSAGVFLVQGADGPFRHPGIALFRGVRRRRMPFELFGQMRNAIRDFGPDVIHTWLPEVITIPAMLLARLYGIPCIASYRSQKRFRGSASQLVEYIAMLFCSRKIVSNNPVAQSNFAYRVLYRMKSGEVVPNAVANWERLPSSGRHAERGAPQRIAFVGRLIQGKNVSCLLAALAILRRSGHWTLDVYGEGPERVRLQREAGALGLQEFVTFHGYISDVRSGLGQADVMVLPSWSEGMPNVVLEAMQVGIPCILSDIPAHRELTREHRCALLFDPKSPEDLACRVKEIVTSRDLSRELRVAGHVLANSRSTGRMAEAYASIYRACVLPGKCGSTGLVKGTETS